MRDWQTVSGFRQGRDFKGRKGANHTFLSWCGKEGFEQGKVSRIQKEFTGGDYDSPL